MRRLAELIDLLEASPSHEPARPSATKQLDELEQGSGFVLPADLREFYLRVHRAESAQRYVFLPVEQFKRTGSALNHDDEWADSEPPSWYAFCDVHDGNFVGIDLEPTLDSGNRILDCDHESASPRNVIASSFTEFLDRALAAGGNLYYLDSPPLEQIRVPYRPPATWLRRAYEAWSRDPEIRPRICRTAGCARLCVALSVHCRRHHFEAIQRQPYPFDD